MDKPSHQTLLQGLYAYDFLAIIANVQVVFTFCQNFVAQNSVCLIGSIVLNWQQIIYVKTAMSTKDCTQPQFFMYYDILCSILRCLEPRGMTQLFYVHIVTLVHFLLSLELQKVLDRYTRKSHLPINNAVNIGDVMF